MSATSLPLDIALSFDVLERIFLFCTSGPFTFPPTHNSPHVVLAQVCSAWRNTVFGSMRLWRALSIIPIAGIVAWEPASKFAKEWLSWTSNSKLSLSILDIPCSPQFLHEIIMAHPSRFETIRIYVELPSEVEEFFGTPFESLRRLEIESSYGDPLALPNRMHSFLSLRHLNLLFYGPQTSLPSILRFPLRSLLSLEIKASMTVSEFHELLLSCPSLETCAFTISGEPTLTDNRTIHHPCLKECVLTTDIGDPDAPERLFNPLALPGLESLEFVFMCPQPWSCKTFIPLFQRSECRIRKLWVRPLFGFDVYNLGILLSELPHITELFLPETGTGVHDEETVRKIGSGECLPWLERLYVAISLDEADTDRVFDAVEKRAPGGPEGGGRQVSSIRELWCGAPRNLGEKEHARLLELRGKGVIIRTYDRGGRDSKIRILNEL